MGVYIREEDLEIYIGAKELEEISDIIEGEQAKDDKINQSITLAENRINSYIAYLGYGIPLKCADNSTPKIIVEMALDLARYYMYQKRASTEVLYRYEQAIQTLNDMKTGKLGLFCDNGQPPITPTLPNQNIGALAQNNKLSSYFDDSPCYSSCNSFFFRRKGY